jgi:DNA-binding CsgD family transcriptional regulator
LAPCQAAVALVDLEASVEAPESDLTHAFNLTPAEARLASRLVAGLSIESVSRQLGIGYETSRTQLKSVFGKTGTHGQSELVALLSR